MVSQKPGCQRRHVGKSWLLSKCIISPAKGCILQYRVVQAKISFGNMGLTYRQCRHFNFVHSLTLHNWGCHLFRNSPDITIWESFLILYRGDHKQNKSFFSVKTNSTIFSKTQATLVPSFCSLAQDSRANQNSAFQTPVLYNAAPPLFSFVTRRTLQFTMLYSALQCCTSFVFFSSCDLEDLLQVWGDKLWKNANSPTLQAAAAHRPYQL